MTEQQWWILVGWLAFVTALGREWLTRRRIRRSLEAMGLDKPLSPNRPDGKRFR